MKDLEKRVSIIEDKLGIVNGTPKLEVGKWYKYPYYENWKLCITSIDGNDVGGYGVDLSGGWMRSGKWGVIEDELGKLIECTPKEVKEYLEKEAKRRYKVGDKVECLVSRMPSIITEPPYVSTSSSVNAETDCLVSGYIYLFQNGLWAEVIEQPTDKFAELKEAERNGKNIECRIKDFASVWVEKTHKGFFDGFEYRIKPEEKQKTKFHELAYELGITEDYKVDKFVEALTKLSYESESSSLEQDIQQLKDKYKQYKFTITIEDNI